MGVKDTRTSNEWIRGMTSCLSRIKSAFFIRNNCLQSIRAIDLLLDLTKESKII